MIQVKMLAGLETPSYATKNSSGVDLKSNEDVLIFPMERKLVHTGLYMEIPEGYEGQVRPRSGLALKHGITVLNTPGTIDADYRGEICVILYNSNPPGSDPYEVKKGDKIAQMVFASVIQAEIIPVNELSSTDRGEGGFGHSGK